MSDQASPEEIERVTKAATKAVMAKIDVIVSRVVARQIATIQPPHASLRVPPTELVEAAAKVSAMLTNLDNNQYSRGERAAREQLDAAINDLRTAYRAYAADQRLKG